MATDNYASPGRQRADTAQKVHSYLTPPQDERTPYALILSALIHLSIIAFIGLSLRIALNRPSVLEVTTVSHSNVNFTPEVDTLSNANYLAEGNATITRRYTLDNVPLESDEIVAAYRAAASTDAQEAPQAEQDAQTQSFSRQQQQIVLTTTPQSYITSANLELPKRQPNEVNIVLANNAYYDSPEMASAQATLSDHYDTLYKKYNIQTLEVGATGMSAEEARYIHQWVKRVEQEGNQHYPTYSDGTPRAGVLEMLVTLRPNGEIERIEILESSGDALLDSAAIDVVLRAAPFEPFTPEMKRAYQRLELVRRWEFTSNATFGVS